MRRAHLLICILAVALPGMAAEKPNIVFILADDLGYGDLSCYGATHFETPGCDLCGENNLCMPKAYAYIYATSG
jgi:arylsulfatase A